MMVSINILDISINYFVFSKNINLPILITHIIELSNTYFYCKLLMGLSWASKTEQNGDAHNIARNSPKRWIDKKWNNAMISCVRK
jgi:hypothetical protein